MLHGAFHHGADGRGNAKIGFLIQGRGGEIDDYQPPLVIGYEAGSGIDGKRGAADNEQIGLLDFRNGAFDGVLGQLLFV